MASLATMISLAAPAVANAATDADSAATDADSNIDTNLIYVPWYAADSKAEEEAMTKKVKQTIKYIDKETGKQMAKDTKDNVQTLTFHRKELWDIKDGKPTGMVQSPPRQLTATNSSAIRQARRSFQRTNTAQTMKTR